MSAYEADLVAWTEIQAALLGRRAAGELYGGTTSQSLSRIADPRKQR